MFGKITVFYFSILESSSSISLFNFLIFMEFHTISAKRTNKTAIAKIAN